MTVFAVLDPSLLAIPNLAEDETEARDIIGRIRIWGAQVRRRYPRIVREENIIEKLSAIACYPIKPQLEELLSLFTLTHVFSPNDIFREYLSLLDRSGILEDETRLELNIDSVEIKSPLSPMVSRSPAALIDATSDTMGKVVFINNFLARQQSILINGTPLDNSKSADIRAHISVIVGENAPSELVGPASVWGSCPLAKDISSFVCALDAEKLWNEAESAEDLHIAIASKALQILIKSGGSGLSELRQFAIGSEFLASVRVISRSFSGAPPAVLLETCARIVARAPKAPVNPFRDASGSQIARARDGAVGGRTHVTKTSEGIRLMVWEKADLVEFANAANKHEEIIEQGILLGTTNISYGS